MEIINIRVNLENNNPAVPEKIEANVLVDYPTDDVQDYEILERKVEAKKLFSHINEFFVKDRQIDVDDLCMFLNKLSQRISVKINEEFHYAADLRGQKEN